MTREELAQALAAITAARGQRTEIWIQVVEPDGTLAERIFRGTFRLTPPRTEGD